MTELLDQLSANIGTVGFSTLAIVSYLASFITVALGIGGGALLLATMASVMPPAALIPVHGGVQLGSNAIRAAVLLRFVEWPAIGGFALGSVLGVALGGAVVTDLPPWAIQAGVGFFVIWSVLTRPPRWLRRWPWLTGLISSFLTMFFGATGTFVANYTKSLSLSRHNHVATHGALMTLQHTLKILTFGLLGFAFVPWLPLIGALVTAGFLGTLSGKAVLGRMSDRGFKRALNAVLIVISLRLIWKALV